MQIAIRLAAGYSYLPLKAVLCIQNKFDHEMVASHSIYRETSKFLIHDGYRMRKITHFVSICIGKTPEYCTICAVCISKTIFFNNVYFVEALRSLRVCLKKTTGKVNDNHNCCLMSSASLEVK